MPSLDFLKSSPSTEALRFESEPPGAEVKTSSGQTCHTPCEVQVQANADLTATFALAGHKSQTIPVHVDTVNGSTKLAPNPVYAELQVGAETPAKKSKRKKPATAARRAPASSSVANATAWPAPPPASAQSASAESEPAPSATNYPWPSH
jgi:hypothetical protein